MSWWCWTLTRMFSFQDAELYHSEFLGDVSKHARRYSASRSGHIRRPNISVGIATAKITAYLLDANPDSECGHITAKPISASTPPAMLEHIHTELYLSLIILPAWAPR
jgi:hypothetical protein